MDVGSKKRRGGDERDGGDDRRAKAKAAKRSAAGGPKVGGSKVAGSKGGASAKGSKKASGKVRNTPAPVTAAPAAPGPAAPAEQLAQVADPVERYRRATEALEVHQYAVARLSAVRSDAAAEAYGAGLSLRALAVELGVSSSRAHQLVHEARSRQVG